MADTSMSRWWPISLGITSLVFFIAGGALLGTWAGCYLDCSYVTYYAGIALIVVAFFFKIAWIVTLIIYIRRRRYGYRGVTVSTTGAAPYGASTGLLDGRNFSSSQPPPPAQYSFASPAQTRYSADPTVAPMYDNVSAKGPVTYAAAEFPQQHAPGGVRYCLQCGASVHTPFCAHCGCAQPV